MGRLVMIVAALAALCACAKAPEPSPEPGHDAVIAYLLKHPDVIDEAGGLYEARQARARQAQSQAQAAREIPLRRAALEHDPRDFVANPNGRITVVEFFDYRCPYCKASLPQLQALIAGAKDVRFVYKEFPILPDADGRIGVSLRASEAALAAARQGKYQQVHNALMSRKALDDDAIAQALRDCGLDPARLMIPKDAGQHIQDTRDLAIAIGSTGTPTFVVGDTLVDGNRMADLAAAIDKARRSAKT
jgi:protein-disulfide isomerase